MTVADHFADLPPAARDFGVRLVQGAAVKRMFVFGPVGGLFGIGGLVMLFLGRKK